MSWPYMFESATLVIGDLSIPIERLTLGRGKLNVAFEAFQEASHSWFTAHGPRAAEDAQRGDPWTWVVTRRPGAALLFVPR